MSDNFTSQSADFGNGFSSAELDSPSFVSSLHANLGTKTALLVFLVLYLAQVLYYCYAHPLRKVPGPFLARFSQAWRNYHYLRGTWLEDVVNLHEKYGKVVRIAPNEVSFVDVGGLRALYGHGKPSQKTNWYHVWYLPNMTHSFFATTDIKLHRHLRSRVSGAYSMSTMLSVEPLIQDVVDTNWLKFKELVTRGKPVPIHTWANYFAFDVVGQLSLGGKLGMLEQERDVDGIIQSIHDGFWLMANMGNMPLQMFWFNNSFSRWMVKRFGGARLNALDVFLEWLEERVDERMKNGLGDTRRDMLQHFIEAKDQNGQPVKKGDVMIEGVNILGAGADTTSIAILAVLGALLLHPEVKKQLMAEIDQAYKDLGLAENQLEISFKDCETLPLLSAVVKESMRLHPSITYQLPRVVPDQGVQIGPYQFDRRTICGISPAAMNRSKEVFGDDAAEWKPERWIVKSPEDEKRISSMNHEMTTFGMGSRSCVGRNLALVEVHKYIAQFFRHFDAEILNKDQPWITKTQWFSFQSNFWITLKDRQQ